MKLYWLIVGLVTSILLGGCFSTGGSYYQITPPSGKNMQDYFADKLECRKVATSRATYGMAGKYTGAHYSSGDEVSESVLADCLRSKGYELSKGTPKPGDKVFD